MQVKMKWVVALLAAVMGLGGIWLAQRTSSGGGGVTLADGATSSGAAWSLMGAGKDSGPVAQPAAALMTPDQVRTRLYQQGSFQGTEPSGEWCVTDAKMLKPCNGLRGRFEYFVLGVGEVSIAEIRGLIQDEARLAHGDKLAAEIIDIFDKYWQIRTHDWKNNFVQTDRSTWMPVFEEQKSVRRQILGMAWAEAFFADDEKHFLEYFAQLESGQPPPPDPGEPVPQMEPGKDPAAVRAERVSRYGEEAADRLAEVDAQWAAWDRRLAAARAEWDRLQAAPNLSDSQKKDEMDRYVNDNFQGKDVIRIKGLVRY